MERKSSIRPRVGAVAPARRREPPSRSEEVVLLFLGLAFLVASAAFRRGRLVRLALELVLQPRGRVLDAEHGLVQVVRDPERAGAIDGQAFLLLARDRYLRLDGA